MAEISQNRTVTITQLKRALLKCIDMKRPAMITGGPGVGKSDLLRQICKEKGGIMYDLRLSQCDPTDLRGIPFFNKDTCKMEWAPPVDLPDAEVAKQYPICFLFLDEINSAPPAVAAAAYQLILDRRVGTYVLPDNCVVVAAGNRDSDRGVTFRMPTPLANRFVHFELKVDFDSWHDWAIENRIHRDVVGFLNFSKNSLNDFDPKSPNKSFATPRTWEFVSQLVDDDMEESLQTDIIAGTIGEGLALKFQAHRKISSKLPSPDDILSGKVETLEIKEISAFYSLATSLCYLLQDNHSKVKGDKWHEQSDNFLKFAMANFTTELTVFAMKIALQKFDLPFSTTKMKHFKEFKDRFGKYLLKAS